MGSINLLECPSEILRLQAKRRTVTLMLVLCIWVLLMGSVLGSLHIIKNFQSEKLSAIRPQIDRYKHIQLLTAHYKKSQCAAEVIMQLFSHPVHGLHLTRVAFTTHWEIQGTADHPQALSAFKGSLNPIFSHTEWSQQDTNKTLNFHMQGTMAC